MGRRRRWGQRGLSQSMLKIVLNLVPEALCVLVNVHYGISEGYWTKPGPKSTLVVVLLLVLVFQNCPKTCSRSHLNASKCIMESLRVIGPNQVWSPLWLFSFLFLFSRMLKIVLKLAPQAIWVIIKVHCGISEGHWTKPGCCSPFCSCFLEC